MLSTSQSGNAWRPSVCDCTSAHSRNARFGTGCFVSWSRLCAHVSENNIDFLAPVRRRIEATQGCIRDRGADYLLYALMGVSVDGDFPALEEYGERLDALDDRISGKEDRNLIDEIHNV